MNIDPVDIIKNISRNWQEFDESMIEAGNEAVTRIKGRGVLEIRIRKGERSASELAERIMSALGETGI